MDHYLLAIESTPGFFQAHNNLGIVLEMKGARHKAIEHYRRAIAIAPDDFHAHYNLGLAHLALGDNARLYSNSAKPDHRPQLRRRPAKPGRRTRG